MQVYDRNDGHLLARAGEVIFAGGALALFFGVYAVASCPDLRKEEGSAAVTIYDPLEREVLGNVADRPE